jgi:medium-chain acyl-[acyl-carrier-protein] hydrolase
VAVESRLQRSYRVRFDEAGPDGNLSAAGYLRYAQDLAWIHSETAGFGREWYAARGLTWLARAIELEIDAPVTYGAELDVTTHLTGFRRVWARRQTEFCLHDQAVEIARATTDWVLINASGRPVRPPEGVIEAFGSDLADFAPLRLLDQAAPADAPRHDSTVRRGELDPLGHLNNAAYLDYLDEHYLDIARHAALPQKRRYQIEFVAPAAPGTKVTGLGWADGDEWCYRLEADGRELFRGRLKTRS